MNNIMLTTGDNPYNPFTNFDEWYAFDESKGYCTCGYIDRIATALPSIETDNKTQIEDAMYKILDLNLTGNYLIVTKESFDLEIQNFKTLKR